ncbi:MAG: glycosyltransferase family 9 protein [Candidatus Kapabacteria bacterium]|nr:glycosyltransferase family 9 protein [Candidatus Kapabacteria bacterium]
MLYFRPVANRYQGDALAAWQSLRQFSSTLIVRVQSILVLRLGQLGDVLLATPLVRLLRLRYPDARIDVAVAQQFADVWKNNPHCTSVIPVDTGASFIATRPLIRSILSIHGRYDTAIDLHRNMRTWFLRRNLAESVLCYDKHRTEKRALIRNKKFPAVQTHIADRYIAAASSLDITGDGAGLELWLPEEQSSQTYPPSLRKNTGRMNRVALAPGAQHATKRWLPEYVASVASHYAESGCEVVLIGSAKERDLCAAIRHRVPVALQHRVQSFAGESLYQSARLLDSCDVCISNDSGAVHLAAARSIPVVAIYGSTVPALGFSPYRTPHRIAEADLDCRPCTHIGRNECPLGHFNCMKLIEPETVIAHADGISGISGSHQQTITQ